MSVSRDADVIVIGAGAAGLAAGLELRRAGLEVVVLEAGDRPGGALRTDTVRGHLVERGPNTLQAKAPALELLRAHGLESALVAAKPASRLRFLFHGGRLEPVPSGPVAFVRTPLLSVRGKLRLAAEPFVRRGDARSESAAEFMARRFGSEVVERLVGPALTGIYAGDETQLGADAVLGFATALERSHGSVVRGALAGALRRRAAPRGLTGSFSLPTGLGGLASALAAPLGEALVLGARVEALARDGAGFRVEVGGGRGARELHARGVVVAAPAPEAAALLKAIAPDAAEAAARVTYVPVVSASLSVDPRDARERLEGFGFLVPAGAGLRLLGCLFMSRLFAGRAPAGRVLLTCLVGGARWPEALDEPDAALLARLHDELGSTVGLRGAAEPLGITRWPRAVAQPGRDHPALVAALRRSLAPLPGLTVAGAWLDGVSIADTLACGARAAHELCAGLAP